MTLKYQFCNLDNISKAARNNLFSFVLNNFFKYKGYFTWYRHTYAMHHTINSALFMQLTRLNTLNTLNKKKYSLK